jgi:glutamine amidotransferase
MIGIINYEAGNIRSVSNALRTIGVDFLVSADPKELDRCQGIILPGVGAAPGAMASLDRSGITTYLKKVKKPLLGICLGMQLLYERSEEGDTSCLGVIPGEVKKLSSDAVKIPHIGWNMVTTENGCSLLNEIGGGKYFYFAHSYYAPPDNRTQGTTECGVRFASVIAQDNFFGIQFHPEKSGAVGLQLLKNFDTLCKSYRR